MKHKKETGIMVIAKVSFISRILFCLGIWSFGCAALHASAVAESRRLRHPDLSEKDLKELQEDYLNTNGIGVKLAKSEGDKQIVAPGIYPIPEAYLDVVARIANIEEKELKDSLGLFKDLLNNAAKCKDCSDLRLREQEALKIIAVLCSGESCDDCSLDGYEFLYNVLLTSWLNKKGYFLKQGCVDCIQEGLVVAYLREFIKEDSFDAKALWEHLSTQSVSRHHEPLAWSRVMLSRGFGVKQSVRYVLVEHCKEKLRNAGYENFEQAFEFPFESTECVSESLSQVSLSHSPKKTSAKRAKRIAERAEQKKKALEDLQASTQRTNAPVVHDNVAKVLLPEFNAVAAEQGVVIEGPKTGSPEGQRGSDGGRAVLAVELTVRLPESLPANVQVQGAAVNNNNNNNVSQNSVPEPNAVAAEQVKVAGNLAPAGQSEIQFNSPAPSRWRVFFQRPVVRFALIAAGATLCAACGLGGQELYRRYKAAQLLTKAPVVVANVSWFSRLTALLSRWKIALIG